MKIESGNITPLAQVQNGAQRTSSNVEAQAAAQQTSAVDSGSATVSLSSISTPRADAGADIDTAKVEAIKAALRDGSYTIDSGKIADGMMSNARDLLQTRKSPV
jgi:negative regulator of flagellin synthesis FlgM